MPLTNKQTKTPQKFPEETECIFIRFLNYVRLGMQVINPRADRLEDETKSNFIIKNDFPTGSLCY